MPRVYVSLIQSDFGRSRHGNFEAVIVEGDQLWHWSRDNSTNDFGPWTRGQRITGEQDQVAGPGCIIQFTSRPGQHGNFEVVVPLRRADGPKTNNSVELRHFYRDNSDAHLPSPLRQRLTMSLHVPWVRGQRVTDGHDHVAGPGCIIQSSASTGQHGRFEVVVPLQLGDGSIELRHFFQSNDDAYAPWTKGQFITQSCAGLGGIIQSSFDSVARG